VSATVTRDAEGTVTGNTYDKYGSSNPVVRRLMARSSAHSGELFEHVDPASVLDVGCGEAVLTHSGRAPPGDARRGLRPRGPAIQAEWDSAGAEPRVPDLRAQEPFRTPTEIALATAIEVRSTCRSQHVPRADGRAPPRAAHLLVSVAARAAVAWAQLARGAYVHAAGITPGHGTTGQARLQGAWSRATARSSRRLAVPWTSLLARV
jgi:hypothetical protein